MFRNEPQSTNDADQKNCLGVKQKKNAKMQNIESNFFKNSNRDFSGGIIKSELTSPDTNFVN